MQDDRPAVSITRTKTIVRQDNLNIQGVTLRLYEAFPAAKGRRLVERSRRHYTPKHGSWLHLAESELGVLSAQASPTNKPYRRNYRLGARPQRPQHQIRLALHHQRRTLALNSGIYIK